MMIQNKDQIKLDAHAALCNRIKELYKRKNADYGDSVGQLYDRLGDISMLTRISDKYNRLMSLLDPNSTKEPNFESVDDTILDMANYCIIWLMERELKRDEEEMKKAATQREVLNIKVPATEPVTKSVAYQIADRNKQLTLSDELIKQIKTTTISKGDLI